MIQSSVRNLYERVFISFVRFFVVIVGIRNLQDINFFARYVQNVLSSPGTETKKIKETRKN